MKPLPAHRLLLAAGLMAAAAAASAGPPALEPDAEGRAFFDGAAARPALAPIPVSASLRAATLLTPLPAPQPSPPPRHRPLFSDPKRQKEFEELIGPQGPSPSPYLFGEQAGSLFMGRLQPAFDFLDGFSDRLYEFVSLHLVSHVLPRRFYGDLDKSPRADSFRIFDAKFHDKEMRFLQRMWDTAPRPAANQSAPADEGRISDWQKWAADEQASVLVDSLGDAFVERFRFEKTGDKIGADAGDVRNWTPRVVALGGVVGGAILYFFGLHTTAVYRSLRLHVDMSAADKVVDAVQAHADRGRALGLELGYNKFPVAAYTDVNVDRGNFRSDLYGLRLATRFTAYPFEGGWLCN